MWDNLDKFIEACHNTSVACEKCATASLFDRDVQKMRNCILLARECSAMCLATARILSVGLERFEMLFRACEEMCMACSRECGLHADKPHCKQAAEACRKTAELCRRMVPAMVR
jgi:hypothetical protein